MISGGTVTAFDAASQEYLLITIPLSQAPRHCVRWYIGTGAYTRCRYRHSHSFSQVADRQGLARIGQSIVDLEV